MNRYWDIGVWSEVPPYHFQAAFLLRLHRWDCDGEVRGFPALQAAAAGARPAAPILIAGRHLKQEELLSLKWAGEEEGKKVRP